MAQKYHLVLVMFIIPNIYLYNRNSKLHKRIRVAYNKDSLDNIEQVGKWLSDINEEMKELLQILKK